jgi:hypothetical protein
MQNEREMGAKAIDLAKYEGEEVTADGAKRFGL